MNKDLKSPWILTDDASSQCLRAIGQLDTEFATVFELIDILTVGTMEGKEFHICQSIVDTSKYTPDQISGYLEPYYGSVEACKSFYEESEFNQILAECIFETDTPGMDVPEGMCFKTRAEADKAISSITGLNIAPELELTQEMIERNDEIDNAVYALILTLTEKTEDELEWDMELIGDITDAIISELWHSHKMRVRHPSIETDEDGNQSYIKYDYWDEEDKNP